MKQVFEQRKPQRRPRRTAEESSLAAMTVAGPGPADTTDTEDLLERIAGVLAQVPA